MSKEPSSVTVIVTPRERFSVCLDSLNSVVSHTAHPHRLIYIDGGTPSHLSSEIAQICETAGYDHIQTNRFLSPNEARNIGIRLATTDYVVFVDNDVIVSEGWLKALVDCAAETGADVVGPLTCQKLPLHTEIHQAGGLFADDHLACPT
jgi:GT2 family glycosyltransferase